MPGRRRAFRPADGAAGREAAPPADGPQQSRDEQPVGWGDEPSGSAQDDDVARFLADRPPHHDRT